jgi:tape measure domain-containing protein
MRGFLLPGEKCMAIKDRLIQFILRGKDELSPEAKKAAEAIEKLSEESTRLGQELDSAKNAQGLTNSLKNTTRAVEQSERILSQAETQVKELRDALDRSPGSEGLKQSLKQAEREVTRTNRQLVALRDNLKEQEQAAKAAGVDTANLANEEERLSKRVTEAKTSLASNTEQLKALQREQAAAARGAAEHASRIVAARDAMASGVRQAVAFAAAYVSISAAFNLVQRGLGVVREGIFSMLGTGDQFELLGKRLTSLMGSVAGGEKATAWIKQFAKDTPLEVTDVTEAFALLKSYGLDPMGGSLQAIVDKNEELGGGMERLTGIASALGQAYAKQKLQTEEILQLVERGVPVWTLLEKVTGKNTAQLQDLATKGKLGRDVIKALITEMGKSSEGAAASSMGTLTGLVSNLSDTWSGFLDRIAKSGALDYVKGKLSGLADYIDEMDKNGILDKIAQDLSNAFVGASESVSEYLKSLRKLDLGKLSEDASNLSKKIGPAIDLTVTAGKYATATLTTVWNGFSLLVNSTAAVLAKGVQLSAGNLIRAYGGIAGLVGGDEVKARAENLYQMLAETSDGFVKQAATDIEQIGEAWDFIDQKGANSTQQAAEREEEKTAKVQSELDVQRMLNQAHADNLVAQQQRVVDAAASGRSAIVDMANAVTLIDTAKTVQQLEGLRDALLTAYQDGKLSQEEFTNATSLLNTKLKSTGSAATDAADGVSDLTDKLGDLKSVQEAISSAKTGVDITNINTALRKLYNDGTITATEYNDAVIKVSARQKELKQAIDDSRKSQDAKNASDQESIKTSEQLRRESGERMEAERQAGDQAMQDRRKGADSAQQDMQAMGDFFGGVMTRAREPLAQMSEAALAAFDKLQGLSTVDMSLDTSGLKETTASLQKATDALAEMEAAAITVGASGLGKWMADTALRSQELQVQFLKQKQSMQSLLDGYENGDITLEDFTKRAASARNGLNLLNDSDMRTLEGALESARQKMEQLQQGSQSTLASLQEELMGLRGETEALERSKFNSRRADLQQQIVEAQKSGDSTSLANLYKAMSTLSQIEEATSQQRQSQEQAKRVEQNAAAPEAPPAAPTKIIRLESRGKTVDVAVNSSTDETNLLSILEDAGQRAI